MENKYDVGNGELLAVKLDLEEWTHWLEGAEFPFVVWTDHKNLAYNQTFNFSITNRPGSQNVKPDALSRQYASEDSPSNPDTILPSACVVGALTLEAESEVREAQHDDPDPGTGSPNRLYIPNSVCSQILQWGNASQISYHPGIG